ncbi:MAG: ribonuclease E/G [Defluviitaleaceae bacterium]|nr:ribonuclease E/G [Defluviitaleaceae bacterium]
MKQLFIKSTEENTRFALAEDGAFVELFITAGATDSWVGRVIVGRIKTILPGLFAFIDIGAKKNAFMNLRKGHGLKAGDAVVVQVEKDAVGTKGMYVGLEISLKGRLVVVYAGGDLVGVSRKIGNEKEARRLKKIVRKILPPGFGAIIRTNAQGASAEEIAEEITHLHARLAEILGRGEFTRPPTVLFPARDDAQGTKSLLSDILSDGLDEIRIDAPDDFFEQVKTTICEILPTAEEKISREKISMKKQIRTALEKESPLPCGGYITIEQTEACVVIDVNTGANVGKTDYAAAVLETNINAARAVAAQIRLRNLSGIVLIDFIDMSAADHKSAVLDALSAAIKNDRIKVEIVGFVGLGMLQLTRRRTRPPIAEILQKKCPHCGAMQ